MSVKSVECVYTMTKQSSLLMVFLTEFSFSCNSDLLINPNVPKWQEKSHTGWQKLCCNTKLSLMSYTEWATHYIKHTDKWITTYLTCKLQGKNGDLLFSTLHIHRECRQLWLHTVTMPGTCVGAFNPQHQYIQQVYMNVLSTECCFCSGWRYDRNILWEGQHCAKLQPHIHRNIHFCSRYTWTPNITSTLKYN
jgi:hypothetical protein